MRAAVVVPDLRGVLATVVAGAGITVLPRYLAANALEQGELTVLHQPELSPINTIYLVVRAGSLAQQRIALVHQKLLTEARSW